MVKIAPREADSFVRHAPVGSLAPNAWGLYDVHGNVWEWCLDRYEADFYGHSPPVDPVAQGRSAASRVNRGSCFSDTSLRARSAHRSLDTPSNARDTLGIRPARAIDTAGAGVQEQ